MTLYVRTQASTQIGMGHFMRCFALAEAARAADIPVTFVMDDAGEAVRARCAAIGASLIAVGATVASDTDVMAMVGLGLSRKDWLVIDSYAADAAYVALQARSAPVAVLDDLGVLDTYDCDLLINPAMAASGMGYERRTRGRCLLGASYALIRAEFRRQAAQVGDGHVAVMFGGADPTGLTGRCVDMIHAAMPQAGLRVIVGPANTHTNFVVETYKDIQNIRVAVDPPSVAEFLAGSALVVTAAGGSVGEVAALALPALVLVVYDNQAAALSACPFPVIDARAGLPDDIGETVRALVADPARGIAIAAHAHAIVDGHGPRRILEAMGYV